MMNARLFLAFAVSAVLLAGGAVARAADTPPSVTNPHGNYQEDCSLCHGAKAWKPVHISKKFDHGRFLPLVGAHASINCTQCHKSLDFSMTSTACNDCHADVHNGELGTDCARCHGTRSFVDRNDHIRLHRATRFPLAGAHASLDCQMCHQLASPDANTYVNTPTECVSCHQADYDKTTNPAHATAGFPTDCTQCHDQVVWSRARFDHNNTGFPLTGAHAGLSCEHCHVGGVFTGLSANCVSCHQTDYNGTNDPAHQAAGFSTSCTQCHNTTRWSDAFFNHSGTAFPLTGAHKTVTCNNNSCHGGGVYAGHPSNCVDCHQTDYNGTNDPPHLAAGFPTDCKPCHNTTNWTGATFDHSATAFPLAGAHKSVACNNNSCHGGGVYAGHPSKCLDCHQSDYNGTSDPNHAAAGFPTDCTQCHTQTSWSGATFNHTAFFPIASGRHSGNPCSACHTNSASYADFNCLGCHPHSDKAQTDSHHNGENGYSYDSDSCYRCHPTGRAG